MSVRNPPPLPIRRKSRFSGCGCLGGTAVLLLLLTGVCVGVFLVFQNSRGFFGGSSSGEPAIPADFVGVWECSDDTEQGRINIAANGSADCAVQGRGFSYNINLAHASYDPQTRRLSIKLFFLGPSWLVDEYPHNVDGGAEFTINHHVYRRIRVLDGSRTTIGI